jgi:hypothetical protein
VREQLVHLPLDSGHLLRDILELDIVAGSIVGHRPGRCRRGEREDARRENENPQQTFTHRRTPNPQLQPPAHEDERCLRKRDDRA